jgi:Domain of unknown function (DUF4283)
VQRSIAKHNMDLNNEELIERFMTLNAHEKLPPQELMLANQAFTDRDWSKCMIAKVISDKIVLDTQFVTTMARVWDIGQEGTIVPIEKNTYLIQCVNACEVSKLITRGSWNYRADLVALKKAEGPSDLNSEFVQSMELWVQLHRVPPEVFSEEGLAMLAMKVGTPMSDVQRVMIGGQRCYKVKVILPIKAPLQDRLIINHPRMGQIVIALVYERVNRACTFCGLVGHEIGNCQDRLRITRLKYEPAYKNRPEMKTILDPKFGSWMMGQGTIPSLGGPKPDQATPHPQEEARHNIRNRTNRPHNQHAHTPDNATEPNNQARSSDLSDQEGAHRECTIGAQACMPAWNQLELTINQVTEDTRTRLDPNSMGTGTSRIGRRYHQTCSPLPATAQCQPEKMTLDQFEKEFMEDIAETSSNNHKRRKATNRDSSPNHQ